MYIFHFLQALFRQHLVVRRPGTPKRVASDKLTADSLYNSDLTMNNSSFDTLPSALQRAIDEAFDKYSVRTRGSSSQPIEDEEYDNHQVRKGKGKEKARETEPLAGGGFIIDDDTEMQGGGFILDEEGDDESDEVAMGGGFLVEDSGVEPRPSKSQRQVKFHSKSKPTHITLQAIPSALQHLDLPPDDEEVLAVFANAASGWSSSSLAPDYSAGPRYKANLGETSDDSGQDEVDGDLVSREDWHSVCSVLLEGRAGAFADPPQGDDDDDAVVVDDDFEMCGGFIPASDVRRRRRPGGRQAHATEHDLEYEELDDGEESDEYVDEDMDIRGAETDESDVEPDDEYIEGTNKSRRGGAQSAIMKTRSRKRAHNTSDGDDARTTKGTRAALNPKEPRETTARQRQACIAAYALFFPDIPTSEPEKLLQQRIMIKDIQRVTKLVGQSLKADEVPFLFYFCCCHVGSLDANW